MRRGLSSPAPRGERGAAVKTIARGMPVVSAEPVVTAACFSCCRRAMGAACIRHSLRPPSFEGTWTMQDPGRSCRGKASVCERDPGPISHRPQLLSRMSTRCGHRENSAVWVPGVRRNDGLGFGRLRTHRSPILTIFWHCGHTAFSSRTTPGHRFRQRTVNGFGRGFWGLEGSGNADSQASGWSSGSGGDARACDSGCCEGAHPASWRASPSYRPLRAVWAVCAWALRGCARTPKPFSAQRYSAPIQKESLP